MLLLSRPCPSCVGEVDDAPAAPGSPAGRAAGTLPVGTVTQAGFCAARLGLTETRTVTELIDLLM